MPTTKPNTYQDMVLLAISLAGGQSALARMIEERFKVSATQQAIWYLKNNGNDVKVAQGSRLTPYLLKIAGLSRTWSPGQKIEPAKTKKAAVEPLNPARKVKVKIKETGRRVTVELTDEAIKVAKAFMEMDINDRREIAHQVRSKIVALRLRAKPVPDEELDDLAAPGTPAAERAKAKKAAAKKPTKPPSRHAQ